MNHLAHALIAHRTGTSLVGNLLGDFVKGRPEDAWSGDLLLGIRLHRRVDAFTDDHPAFMRCRARFRPGFRRFAGILVDLFWDHVLARDWPRYGPATLAGFTNDVYVTLGESRPILPERMLRFVDYMTSTNLLVAYAERDGIARALEGMSRRMKRENPLSEGIVELDRLGIEITSDFGEFLPDLWSELGVG